MVIAPSRSSNSLLGGKYASGSSNTSRYNSLGLLSNNYGIQTIDTQKCIIFDYKRKFISTYCYQPFFDELELFEDQFPSPFISVKFKVKMIDKFENNDKYNDKFKQW